MNNGTLKKAMMMIGKDIKNTKELMPDSRHKSQKLKMLRGLFNVASLSRTNRRACLEYVDYTPMDIESLEIYLECKGVSHE